MKTKNEPTQEQVNREMDLVLGIVEAIKSYCDAGENAPTLADADDVARVLRNQATILREQIVSGLWEQASKRRMTLKRIK